MSLKKNEVEVLRLVVDGFTFNEVVQQLKTSERNIRYMIENLNFYLKKILNKQIEKEKQNLILSLSKSEMENFLRIIYKDYYILDQEERVEFILLTFLFVEDVTLSLIEKKLYITRGTLKKDIELLNRSLENHGLKLESSKNKFSIVGNEKKLRHLKTLKYFKYNSLDLIWIDKNWIFNNIDKEKITSFGDTILKIEKEFFIEFKNDFKKLIEIFLYFSLKRINKGFIINKKINYKFLIGTPHYEIVKNNLEKIIDVNLTYELVHITEYFISGGTKENLDESKESVKKYIQELLFILSMKLKISFDNEDLKLKLIRYLIPAIYRLKNNFSIDEQGEEDEIYKIIEEYSNSENYLPEKLTKNEILYIAKGIKKEIELEKMRILSLKNLLETIEKNCIILDKDQLKKDLINSYSMFIKNDI